MAWPLVEELFFAAPLTSSWKSISLLISLGEPPNLRPNSSADILYEKKLLIRLFAIFYLYFLSLEYIYTDWLIIILVYVQSEAYPEIRWGGGAVGNWFLN